MAQILTLCERCRKELEDSLFKVRPVTPTEKKTSCEYCGRKFRDADLKQFTINGR